MAFSNNRDLRLTVVDVQAVPTALRNLTARVEQRVRRVVKESGDFTRDRALELMLDMGIYDTGFMYEHLESRVSPKGLAFQVGWWPEDFRAAGLELYYLYVVLGTSMMGARDPLTPAYDEMRDYIRQAIADAINGESRSGRRR